MSRGNLRRRGWCASSNTPLLLPKAPHHLTTVTFRGRKARRDPNTAGPNQIRCLPLGAFGCLVCPYAAHDARWPSRRGNIRYRGATARVSCRRSVPDVKYIAARENKRSGPLKIGMHDLGSSNDLAAKLLLQVTTRVLAEEWENTFRYWYPDLRSKTDPKVGFAPGI